MDETARKTEWILCTERWEKVADELIAAGKLTQGETRESFVRYWRNADMHAARS